MVQLKISLSDNLPGEATRQVFKILADSGISVDLINILPRQVMFTVSRENAGQAIAKLEAAGYNLDIIADCAKVSVVGGGMRGTPGVMADFIEALKDIYTRQTRLIQVPRNGDLQLEGEITGFDLTPMAIGSDAFSQETKLTITIKVKFVNTKDEKQNFETTMSMHRNFPNSQQLFEVQDQLVAEIVKELTEMIFNRTVANW